MRKTVWGAITLGIATAIAAGALGTPTLKAQEAAARRYIIITHGQGPSPAVDAAVAAAGGVVTGVVPEIGVVTASSTDPGFAHAIKQDARVQYAVEDVEVQWLPDVHASPAAIDDVQQQGVNTEPYNAYLWNLRAIGANLTAAAGIVGNNVKRARVAVLDSGLWTRHPDLADNVNTALAKSYVLTADVIDTDDDGEPDTSVPAEPGVEPIVAGYNHGTHVTGILAARINNRGGQGVAPAAEIIPVKVLRSTTGSGSFVWVAQGLVYAANNDADVINMSIGATFARPLAGGYGPYIAMLTRAINYATQRGALVVTAAGNEGVNLDSVLWSVPAQLGIGMAVSATGPEGIAVNGEANTNLDRFASYSNYGRSVVNVAAPGGDFALYPDAAYVFDMILAAGGVSCTSTGCSYAYYFGAGTSMAAPHVAGLAALLVGEYGRTPPSQLKALIEKSAVDLYAPGADRFSGRGRIDAARAFGLR